MNKPRSESLFHFTKNYENLVNILHNGFKPSYCLEDKRWLGLDNGDAWAYPMLCFCDIPLSRISSHTGRYGNYGIGLTKDWGLRNKLTPVIYTANDSPAADVARHLILSYFSNPPQQNASESNRFFYRLMSLIKPIKGIQYPNTSQEIDFYQENEWRLVPEVPHGREALDQGYFEILKDEYFLDAVLFKPNDIKYLFVESDSEIPTLWDSIYSSGCFSLDERKNLTTKIFSLETLKRDI
jgi:hypothetical protein